MIDSEAHISDEDFFALARSLENKHAIFYKFWEVGKPHFTTDIVTAGVSFDKKGNSILFSFNPCFWNSIDDYTRRFVICHEMLHIILNHGIRIRDIEPINAPAANMCLDVVINHLLVNKFGFSRQNLKGLSMEFLETVKRSRGSCPRAVPEINKKPHNDYRDFCWVDTSFDPSISPELNATLRGKLPPDDMSFEYYYRLLPKKDYQVTMAIGGGNTDDNDGAKSHGQGAFDSHDGLVDVGDFNAIMEDINKKLSPEEKQELKEMIDDNFQKDTQSEKQTGEKTETGIQAGGQEGSVWTFETAVKVNKKKRWETIIHRWADKQYKYSFRDIEQWPRLNPRLSELPKDFFIPSEMEMYDLAMEDLRIKVWFVIDNSGSCHGLFKRFATAAMSLPEERFDVRLWCFDTRMHEVIVEKHGLKALGGGGTIFKCIEDRVQHAVKIENEPYPSALFVLTDGYSSGTVVPEIPENWYWFLTTKNTKCIPSKCIELEQVYQLKDFE